MTPRHQRSTVTALRERPTADVLIVGAGINGLATFRDLALQGVDVVIVDRSDYGSGTTSASSHMIHGGIRYLENGEFRLVKESVMERNGLLKTAPHLVKPLATVIPIGSLFSGIIAAPLRMLRHRSASPRPRGALLIKVGLTIYDTFSRDGGTVPRHVFRGRRASRSEYPQLADTTKYTATYYDASVHDPERLALDVLRDGIAAGGRAANYVAAVRSEDGAVLLRDEDTAEEFAFRARVVVNASGPWTDLTNGALGRPSAFLGGTKGSHIVLDNPQLLEATRGREIFFEHTDGRIVLIYPLRDRVMVGTTDIEVDPRETVQCTEEEVDYFIELVAQVFPRIAVDRSQIVYRFAGIRPLPGHGDLAPGFVSRDYRIVSGTLEESTLLSIVGGKLTTFRALGEHVTNEVLTALARPRTVSTRGLPIGGGTGYPVTELERIAWCQRWSAVVGGERALELLDRYGTVAADYLASITEPEQQIDGASDYSAEEVRWLATDQDAVHLLDLLQRRTSLAMLGRLTADLIAEFATVVASALGWTAERQAEETARTLELLTDAHGWPRDAAVPKP